MRTFGEPRREHRGLVAGKCLQRGGGWKALEARGLQPAILGKDYYVTEALREIAAAALGKPLRPEDLRAVLEHWIQATNALQAPC